MNLHTYDGAPIMARHFTPLTGDADAPLSLYTAAERVR